MTVPWSPDELTQIERQTRGMSPQQKTHWIRDNTDIRPWYCHQHQTVCLPSLTYPGAHHPIDVEFADAMTKPDGTTTTSRWALCLTCPATTPCWHLLLYLLTRHQITPARAPHHSYGEPLHSTHKRTDIFQPEPRRRHQ